MFFYTDYKEALKDKENIDNRPTELLTFTIFKMEDLLFDEYSKLSTCKNPEVRLNLLNNIIRIKLDNRNYSNYRKSLYQDLRAFIKTNIEVAQTSDFRYDHLKLNIFQDLISSLDLEEQLKLTDHYLRLLEQSSFKEEMKHIFNLKYKTLLLINLKKWYQPKHFLNIITYYPLISLKTLGISLAAICILCVLITLPAPLPFLGILNLKLNYVEYSTNSFLNHSINIISHLLSISTNFKIQAQDIFSGFCLILGKGISILFIGSILFNKLIEYFKR